MYIQYFFKKKRNELFFMVATSRYCFHFKALSFPLCFFKKNILPSNFSFWFQILPFIFFFHYVISINSSLYTLLSVQLLIKHFLLSTKCTMSCRRMLHSRSSQRPFFTDKTPHLQWVHTCSLCLIPSCSTIYIYEFHFFSRILFLVIWTRF